jgi:hypothetical protein
MIYNVEIIIVVIMTALLLKYQISFDYKVNFTASSIIIMYLGTYYNTLSNRRSTALFVTNKALKSAHNNA